MTKEEIVKEIKWRMEMLSSFLETYKRHDYPTSRKDDKWSRLDELESLLETIERNLV